MMLWTERQLLMLTTALCVAYEYDPQTLTAEHPAGALRYATTPAANLKTTSADTRVVFNTTKADTVHVEPNVRY